MAGATALSFILGTVPAYADPAFMVGLAMNFGGGASKAGITGKVLSSNIANEFVGAAGMTYFFSDQSVGFDAGVGYTFDGSSVTFTYDFTNNQPQIAVGASNTKEKINSVC